MAPHDSPHFEPSKLTDFLDHAEDFIGQMADPDSMGPVSQSLKEYVCGYLRDVPMEPLMLERIAVFLADHTYRFAASIESYRPLETRAYFDLVMSHLWAAMAARNVRVFYVLDNGLRDDRYEFTCDLFKWSGFAVLNPYFEGASEENLARAVEVEVCAGRNIAYIEKDSSINLLEAAVAMGRASSLYTTVFRNEAPTNPNVACWMASQSN